MPDAWAPLETTTDEEATFLSPLDPVSARGRAKPLFGFDYVWEVYKPAHQRRWGYYTLPILWGDRLVARFDSKLDRSTEHARHQRPVAGGRRSPATPDFAAALAGGWLGSARFLDAKRVDAAAVTQPTLRTALRRPARRNPTRIGVQGQNGTYRPPTRAGRKGHGDEATMTDEQALERYRYMLATAPPEEIERAHEEAFAQLTPEQRRQALQALAGHVPRERAPRRRPGLARPGGDQGGDPPARAPSSAPGVPAARGSGLGAGS